MKKPNPKHHFVEKVWGSEEWIANNENYCGKILRVKQGFRSSIHYHKNKDETFYVASGRVLLELGSKKIVLSEGDSQRLLQNQKHRFTGIKNSIIIEFSTHHDEEDSYREIESGKLSAEEFEKLKDLK